MSYYDFNLIKHVDYVFYCIHIEIYCIKLSPTINGHNNPNRNKRYLLQTPDVFVELHNTESFKYSIKCCNSI